MDINTYIMNKLHQKAHINNSDCIGCTSFFPKNYSLCYEKVWLLLIPTLNFNGNSFLPRGLELIVQGIAALINTNTNLHFDKYLLIGEKIDFEKKNHQQNSYGVIKEKLERKYTKQNQVKKLDMKFGNILRQQKVFFSVKKGIVLKKRYTKQLRQQIIRRIKKLQPKNQIKQMIDNNKLDIEFVPVLDSPDKGSNQNFKEQYLIRIRVLKQNYCNFVLIKESIGIFQDTQNMKILEGTGIYKYIQKKYYDSSHRYFHKHKNIKCSKPLAFDEVENPQQQQNIYEIIPFNVNVNQIETVKYKKILILGKNLQQLKNFLINIFNAAKIGSIKIKCISVTLQQKTYHGLQLRHTQSNNQQSKIKEQIKKIRQQRNFKWYHLGDVLLVKKPKQLKEFKEQIQRTHRQKNIKKLEYGQKTFAMQTNQFFKFHSKEQAQNVAVVLHGEKISFNFVKDKTVNDIKWGLQFQQQQQHSINSRNKIYHRHNITHKSNNQANQEINVQEE